MPVQEAVRAARGALAFKDKRLTPGGFELPSDWEIYIETVFLNFSEIRWDEGSVNSKAERRLEAARAPRCSVPAQEALPDDIAVFFSFPAYIFFMANLSPLSLRQHCP